MNDGEIGIEEFKKLVRITAHELNNTLAILLGSTEIIQMYCNKDIVPKDKLINKLNSISKTITRMAGITGSLHNVSESNSSIELKEISLSSVFSFIEESYSFDSEVSISMPVDTEYKVQVNKKHFCKAIIKLLQNSMDAIGLVEGPRWIKVEAEEVEAYLVIKITDSGQITSEETIKNMTKIFFTTKDQSKHLGVGLTLAKKIIESHRGELYYNTFNENTQFIIKIPNG